MKIYTQYKPAGTKSFRLSAAKLKDRPSVNIQQIDDEFFKLLKPREGMCFVKVDQAGAESRIVAYLARRGNYRRLIELKVKHHTYVALQLYPEIFGKQYKGVPPDELIKLPNWIELRDTVNSSGNPYAIAKMTVHASSYGIGPGELSDRIMDKSNGKLYLSLNEAKKVLDTFYRTFPELAEWQGLVIKTVKQYRELRNLFGYPRKFEGQFHDRYFKEALSFIPQSTVACLNNIVFTELQEEIESGRLAGNLLLNVHDSIGMEVPIADKEKAIEVIQRLYASHELKGWDNTIFRMETEVQ